MFGTYIQYVLHLYLLFVSCLGSVSVYYLKMCYIESQVSLLFCVGEMCFKEADSFDAMGFLVRVEKTSGQACPRYSAPNRPIRKQMSR